VRIKLTNKTKYCTADLRAFLRAGFRAYGTRVNKIVVVRYWRVAYHYTDQSTSERVPVMSRVAGRGRLGRPDREAQHIWLHLPRDHGALSVGDLAHTLYHELLHNRGARHRDMTPEQMRWNGVPAPWTNGLSIGLEPAKPKPSREQRLSRLIEEREAHARQKLREAQTRLRRARTIERAWHAKVKYYERVAAKKGKT
jgi:hypothetical protein